MLDVRMRGESVLVCLVRHVNYYFNSNGRSSANANCAVNRFVFIFNRSVSRSCRRGESWIEQKKTLGTCFVVWADAERCRKLKKVTCEGRARRTRIYLFGSHFSDGILVSNIEPISRRRPYWFHFGSSPEPNIQIASQTKTAK